MTERLAWHEIEAIGKGYDPVAVRSHSINTDCYRDARFLQLEREHIFYKSWQFLCHEEKLREPGSYVAADVQGRSVVRSRFGREAAGLLQRLQAPRARAAGRRGQDQDHHLPLPRMGLQPRRQAQPGAPL